MAYLVKLMLAFGDRFSVAMEAPELLHRNRLSRVRQISLFAGSAAKGVYVAIAVVGLAYWLVVASWDLHSQ